MYFLISASKPINLRSLQVGLTVGDYFIIFLIGNYWADTNNQRALFMDIAKKLEFNPFVAHNWYNVPLDEILGHKVLNLQRELHVLMVFAGRVAIIKVLQQ